MKSHNGKKEDRTLNLSPGALRIERALSLNRSLLRMQQSSGSNLRRDDTTWDRKELSQEGKLARQQRERNADGFAGQVRALWSWPGWRGLGWGQKEAAPDCRVVSKHPQEHSVL